MVTGPKFHAAVRSALAERPQILVVDLSGVTFLAAAGLHVLDVARTEAGDTVMFAVVADGPATVRPIEITGLDGIVDLYTTIEDVIERHAA
ncbi:STAS domain-containing protein [Mycolicibacterium sp. S2-37]|nr:STAS domain-containing protein [Mycolicibacterium sp. S2-37]